jgi:type II secretory pathway component GspD/PulD (secretin)
MMTKISKRLAQAFFFGILGFSGIFVRADNKIRMNFRNQEIINLIETYAKQSGQKFVIDATVRGKVSIFIQEPVSVEEAFNQLSIALALNGYAISTQGDTMVVQSARNVQRNLIEVSTERPIPKPERMYSWIYKLKNVSAAVVVSEMRVLTSKDGEISLHEETNQLVITDFVSNLIRVGETLKQIDIQIDPKIAKIVEAERIRSQAKQNQKSSAESPHPQSPTPGDG